MSKENKFVESFVAALQPAATVNIEGEGDSKKAVVVIDVAKAEEAINAVEGQASLSEIKHADETKANLAAALTSITHRETFNKIKEDESIKGASSSTTIGNDKIDVGIKRHTQAVNPQDPKNKLDVYGQVSIRVNSNISNKRQPCSPIAKQIKSDYVDMYSQ